MIHSHSLILIIHSITLTHSLTYDLIHYLPPMYSFIHTLVHLYTHSTHSLTDTLIHSHTPALVSLVGLLASPPPGPLDQLLFA